jgi:hypothetical protein
MKAYTFLFYGPFLLALLVVGSLLFLYVKGA